MTIEGVPDTSLSDTATIVKTEGSASEITQEEDQRALKISAADTTLHRHTLVQLRELIILARRSAKSKLIERGIGTAAPRDFGMTRLIIHLAASLQPPILGLESVQERVPFLVERIRSRQRKRNPPRQKESGKWYKSFWGYPTPETGGDPRRSQGVSRKITRERPGRSPRRPSRPSRPSPNHPHRRRKRRRRRRQRRKPRPPEAPAER